MGKRLFTGGSGAWSTKKKDTMYYELSSSDFMYTLTFRFYKGRQDRGFPVFHVSKNQPVQRRKQATSDHYKIAPYKKDHTWFSDYYIDVTDLYGPKHDALREALRLASMTDNQKSDVSVPEAKKKLAAKRVTIAQDVEQELEV